MSIIRTIVYAIFFFVPTEVLLAEEIMVGYEYDIDQQIVKPISIESKEKNLIFIYKKFLEKRKSHTNPERSRFITYGVRETKDKKEIPFLDIGADDAHAIGRISKVGDGYVIPVIRAGKAIELYNYMPSRDVIQRIDSHKEPIVSGFIDKVFALANSYVDVTSVGAELRIGYHHYDGSLSMMVDLGGDAGRIISIDDVIESGGRRYIVASSTEEEHEGVLSVWVYSFDSKFDKASRVATRLMQEAVMSLKARFIYSTHNFPSVQVISRKSLREPPIVQLLALNGEPRLVHRFTLSTIEGEGNFALAGICNNAYVFAKKLISENAISTGIEYEIIDSTGKEKRIWTEKMVVGGSLVDFILYPAIDYVFSFANYSKLEDVRRESGWYSWLGYRVDGFDVLKDCHTLSN